MKAIRHTGIVVNDLERALRFYDELLGLKVTRRKDESGAFIDTILGLKNATVTTVKMAAEDGNLIELLYYHSPQRKAAGSRAVNGAGLSHIAFTVSDAAAEYRRLSAAGVPFISPPQESPDGSAKVAFCRDPEGNYIELTEMVR